MPPTQQYPVTSGTTGFYPGTSPAEYSPYGKAFCQQPTMAKYNHKLKGQIKSQILQAVEASSCPCPFTYAKYSKGLCTVVLLGWLFLFLFCFL